MGIFLMVLDEDARKDTRIILEGRVSDIARLAAFLSLHLSNPHLHQHQHSPIALLPPPFQKASDNIASQPRDVVAVGIPS